VSVLEVDDVSIRFGGLVALSGFTVAVNEWEIVGLIGPNGAGKTTAFNCITGFYKPNEGTIRYRGRDISRTPPHKRAALGLGRTFQNVGLVKGSTVLENLKTAQHARVSYAIGSGILGGAAARLEERELAAKGDAILEMLGLDEYRDARVGSLSYGVLKRLEVGCALATDPDVLLLDEPSSGLGPDEAHELGDRLLDLRRDFAVTVLLIEHHVPLVKAVCDYVYCLNSGRLLAEGTPDEVASHPEVIAAYLGGEAPQALAQTSETEEDAALDSQLHAAVESHEHARDAGSPPARRPRPRPRPRPRQPQYVEPQYAEPEYVEEDYLEEEYAEEDYLEEDYPEPEPEPEPAPRPAAKRAPRAVATRPRPTKRRAP